MKIENNHRVDISQLNMYTFEEYMDHVRTLVAQVKTTGEHSEAHVHFTKLNLQRMERVLKTWELLPEVHAFADSFDGNQLWLLIVESWCGDAALNAPIIAKMANALRIDLHIVLRDEHPELMDRFLTNGTRSIPMLIKLDKHTYTPIGKWGPRQQPAAEMVVQAKETGVPADEWKADLQKWYNQDKGVTLQKEILEILREIASTKNVFISEN
ncbi:MAG: thioredoxin family protein [Chitinophagales bacterium]